MLKKIIKKFTHPRFISLLKNPIYELRNIQEDLKSYFGKYNYSQTLFRLDNWFF